MSDYVEWRVQNILGCCCDCCDLTSVDDEMDEAADSEDDPAPAALGITYAGQWAGTVVQGW